MEIKELVEDFLEDGKIDKAKVEEMIRVGIRKGKKPKTDPKKRKKAREYYKKNKAKILKKAKEWRKKNKAKLKAYAKAYRKKFGEATEKDWEELKKTAETLLDIAEEIDAVLYVILDQMIDEIDSTLTDEDYQEYKQIIDDIMSVLAEEDNGEERNEE